MPDRDQPGLRKRLAIEGRRIAAQHEMLRELWRVALGACENGDLPRLEQALENLDAGMRAHFALEERVQIPALHGSDPSTDRALAGLVAQHVVFRTNLDNASAILARGDLASLTKLLRDLAASMAKHESVEESLFPAP